jgi:dipeptidyl aminopeptidase/acylaminoacyl peptidase
MRSGMALALVLCCSSLAATGAPGASSELIPLEQFTQFDAFGTIKISPDGTTLAATGGKNGRSVLTFVDVRTAKVVASTSSRRPISEFHWVSKTRVLYKVGPYFSAIDKDGTRDIVLYAPEIEGDVFPDLISTLEADADHVLIAQFDIGPSGYANRDGKPRLTRVDVLTGRRDELGRAPLNAPTVLVDHSGQAQFALGYDAADKLALSWRAKPEGPWSDFDLPGFRMDTVRLLRFSSDNASIYLAGARANDAFAALYKVDLATRSIERVAAIEGADVTDVVTSFASRDVVGARGETDRIEYRWFNPEGTTALLYGALARAFPAEQIETTSVSDDGHRAILFVSSGVNPGDYYLFDPRTQKADFISAVRSTIDARRMQPRRAVQIKARDGVTLRAYVTTPAGEGSHPLVVRVRDRPYETLESWRFDWESQLLASRGYAVLQVNSRGTPGLGPDFKTAGYREWGRAMQDDLTDATRWAIEQKIAPADRICIMGVGYGGYAALMGTVREPSLYRCAIGYGGIYDLEYYSRYQDLRHPITRQLYVDQVLGSDVADLKARSPINNVDKIDIPVLLLHGEGNEELGVVPAKRLMRALRIRRQSRQTVEWMDLGWQPNPVNDEEVRRKVCERILAFLDRNLK